MPMPPIVLKTELARAYASIGARLAAGELTLRPAFQIWNGSPDGIESFGDPARRDSMVADALRERMKTSAAIKDFADVCFDTPERRKWLLGLAKART